ncbi:MAG: O-methyltransferase [Microbacteriaceae bacterium]
MNEQVSNWRYAEELYVEDETLAKAREHAVELGLAPVSAAVGAQISVIAAAASAGSIVELGTGTGHTALWAFRGAPSATLTTIDAEQEHHAIAREMFAAAGIPGNRSRLIGGRFSDVLPRLNEASYDLVIVGAITSSPLELVEHGIRLARPGGTILVTGILNNGAVANPAIRDELSQDIRTLIAELVDSPAVVTALSTAGNGLLQIVKIG